MASNPIIPDEIEDGELVDHRDKTKWAILVDTDQGGWIITRVAPVTEIGDYDDDFSNDKHSYMVGAFFDENAESLLKALTEIGGNSIEVNERISDLLSGVCRSFGEAQANLERWRAAQDPDPSQ